MLNHKAWIFNDDENQVFRALELSDGRYLITWDDDGKYREVFYTIHDVLLEIAEEYWVILEEEI